MSDKGRHRTPPRLAERLREWGAPRGRTGQSVVGDAREEFEAHLDSASRVPPALWYWLHVLPIVAHALLFGLSSAPGAIPGAIAAGARDLRIAFRTLARRTGLTLAVVATLGVGMGGLTAALSVVNAVLLDPLPYPAPERLVGIYRFQTTVPTGPPSASRAAGSYAVPPATFEDWREAARSFEAMGAYEGASYAFGTPDGPVRISAISTSSGTFRALGVRPLMGRVITQEEDEIGGPRVAVVSQGFWERMLAADPDILGTTISLNGAPYTVVGVMPAGFSFPYDGVDVWTPLPDSRRGWPSRAGGFLQVVGRLADGVNLEAAQREMATLQTRLAESHSDERNRGVQLYSLRELEVAGSRPGVLLLLGAAALVLLIACTNVANLLLVRAMERHRELAVRTALGGGRLHLVAQLASEGMVLAVLGGVVAVLVAALGVRPLVSVLPVDLRNAGAVRVDPTVLGLAALMTCAVAGLTAVLPALRVVATEVGSALREGSRGVVTAGRSRSHTVLAVSELAFAFVLLSGAGLALRGFHQAADLDPGFESRDRLTMRVVLPEAYRNDGEAVTRFFRDLTGRLAARADVRAVGSASQMPYSGGVSYPPASAETGDGIVSGNVHNSAVTAGYFNVAGMRLVSGRLLTPEDQANTLPVAVVNETLARRYWPDEDPLGHRLRLDLPGDSIWQTVVGVVENVRYGFGWQPFPEFYTTIAQRPLYYQNVVVHPRGDPAAVAQAMRETLWSMEPNIPVTVRTWDELMGRSRGYSFVRFGSAAMAFMAGLAALLAVVGVYGVVAFTVRMRGHEFGIRVALGGAQPTILKAVLLGGLRMAVAGIVLGLAVVWASNRFLDPTLFPTGSRDPLVLSLVSLLLVATGVGASVLPAYRATRVDPVATLRAP